MNILFGWPSKALTIFAGLVMSAMVFAAPVDVSYAVTGSAGDWTLDFSVANNLNPSDMNLYMFGVLLSSSNVVNSPGDFDPTFFPTWSNSPYGGSSLVYNNNWFDPTQSDLNPGQSMSGFQVTINDATAPSEVAWFAVAASPSGGSYSGTDFVNSAQNPIFEGLALPQGVTAVPEPDSYALLAIGAAMACFIRRQKSIA